MIIPLVIEKENGSSIILAIPKGMYPSLRTRVEDIKALGYDNIYIDVPEEDQNNPYIVELMPKKRSMVVHLKSIDPIREPGIRLVTLNGEDPFSRCDTLGEIYKNEDLKEQAIMGNMLAKAIRGYC